MVQTTVGTNGTSPVEHSRNNFLRRKNSVELSRHVFTRSNLVECSSSTEHSRNINILGQVRQKIEPVSSRLKHTKLCRVGQNINHLLIPGLCAFALPTKKVVGMLVTGCCNLSISGTRFQLFCHTKWYDSYEIATRIFQPIIWLYFCYAQKCVLRALLLLQIYCDLKLIFLIHSLIENAAETVVNIGLIRNRICLS